MNDQEKYINSVHTMVEYIIKNHSGNITNVAEMLETVIRENIDIIAELKYNIANGHVSDTGEAKLQVNSLAFMNQMFISVIGSYGLSAPIEDAGKIEELLNGIMNDIDKEDADRIKQTAKRYHDQ